MGTVIKRNPEGGITFMTGEFLESSPCRDCGFESEYLCDFPVGDDKTCDAQLCRDHASEIAPGIHYCPGHHSEWKAFRDAGGVKKQLENIVPFSEIIKIRRG